MRNIKFIDLIYYSIDLIFDIKSVYQSVKKYIFKKKEFATRIFLKMEKTKIIIKITND